MNFVVAFVFLVRFYIMVTSFVLLILEISYSRLILCDYQFELDGTLIINPAVVFQNDEKWWKFWKFQKILRNIIPIWRVQIEHNPMKLYWWWECEYQPPNLIKTLWTTWLRVFKNVEKQWWLYRNFEKSNWKWIFLHKFKINYILVKANYWCNVSVGSALRVSGLILSFFENIYFVWFFMCLGIHSKV